MFLFRYNNRESSEYFCNCACDGEVRKTYWLQRNYRQSEFLSTIRTTKLTVSFVFLLYKISVSVVECEKNRNCAVCISVEKQNCWQVKISEWIFDVNLVRFDTKTNSSRIYIFHSLHYLIDCVGVWGKYLRREIEKKKWIQKQIRRKLCSFVRQLKPTKSTTFNNMQLLILLMWQRVSAHQVQSSSTAAAASIK